MPRLAHCRRLGAGLVVELAPDPVLGPACAPLCDVAWVSVDPARPGVVTSITVEDVREAGSFVARLLGAAATFPAAARSGSGAALAVEPTRELGRFCRLALANWLLTHRTTDRPDRTLLIDVGQASLRAGRIGDAATALDSSAEHLLGLVEEFGDPGPAALRTAFAQALADTDFVLGPRNRHHRPLAGTLALLGHDRAGHPAGTGDADGRPAWWVPLAVRDDAGLIAWRDQQAWRAVNPRVPGVAGPPRAAPPTGGPPWVPGARGCAAPFLHELVAMARPGSLTGEGR